MLNRPGVRIGLPISGSGFSHEAAAYRRLTLKIVGADTEIEKRQQAKDLSLTLRVNREEILNRWAILCRQNLGARRLTHEQLLDHLPRLLDRLAAAVEAASEGHDTSLPIRESQAHALQRLDTGFDLPEITQEYGLLRRVIF